MKYKTIASRLLNIFYVLLIFASLFGIFKLKQVSKKNVEKIIEQNQKEAITLAKKDVLADIIDRGLAAKCVFSQDLITSKISGTMYLSDGLTRTDITTFENTKPDKLSHTIIKKDYMYLWYDKNALGMKLELKANGTNVLESTASQEYSEILTLQNLAGLADTPNYKCDEWEADSFIFVLPPEVTFIDAEQFFKELDIQLCKKCDAEDTEASRLLCRRELECK